MNMHSIGGRFCHSLTPRRAAVLLVALAWSSLAFGGEIHDAAAAGDLERVKALLKDNPDLVFSKDSGGQTPLHGAAFSPNSEIGWYFEGASRRWSDETSSDGQPVLRRNQLRRRALQPV